MPKMALRRRIKEGMCFKELLNRRRRVGCWRGNGVGEEKTNGGEGWER